MLPTSRSPKVADAVKWAVFFAVVVLSTKLSRIECRAGEQTNSSLAEAQRVEQIRAECIQSRRRICGKILKITAEGLVIDSGYTNLMRTPLNRSWLIPGTAKVDRATNLIEANQPGAVCLGPIYLTEIVILIANLTFRVKFYFPFTNKPSMLERMILLLINFIRVR